MLVKLELQKGACSVKQLCNGHFAAERCRSICLLEVGHDLPEPLVAFGLTHGEPVFVHIPTLRLLDEVKSILNGHDDADATAHNLVLLPLGSFLLFSL